MILINNTPDNDVALTARPARSPVQVIPHAGICEGGTE
jgi:hypothetical protein